MDIEFIIEMILNEPIYLSITLLFGLIIIYSVLKKFFKILLISLISLVLYISFLIYTDADLPGESEEIINPLIENAGSMLDQIGKVIEDKMDNNE